MKMDRTDRVPLTPSQQAVVDLPAHTQSLVLGGAGTGKTHVLIERIAKLLSVDNLAAGHDVLLLTFGRETASELRRRTTQAGGDTAYVRATTFDSFATGLLAFIDPEGSWRGGSYDSRITAAEKLIRSDERTQTYISRLRHIVVDEIQDLVGVRAALVLTLLRFAECGFTLLGDPAQAIYNFQLGDQDRQRGSEALFDALRDTYAGLSTFTLCENFRAQTQETRAPLRLGSMLARRDADFEGIRHELETLLLSAKPAPLGLLDRRDGTIVVLCYNNVQALLLSDELSDRGIDHECRRALSDRVVPSWVGDLLGASIASTLSKSDVAEQLGDAEGLPDIDDAWSALRAMAPGSRKTLRLDHIAGTIRAGHTAMDPPPRRSRIVVSTIHRAKGLEFDWGVVVEPDSVSLGHDSPAEDARLLFVALTRSRKGLFSLDSPNTQGWRRSRQGGETRWVFRAPGRKSFTGIEVRGGDIRADVPPGLPGETANETQCYILKSVRAGDSVSLLLRDNPPSASSDPIYSVLHGEVEVGETSDTFGGALKRAGLWRRYGKTIPPPRIEGLRVETVDTVAGTPAAAERAGLAGLGIWNRVRVFGLGRLIYPPAGSSDRATRPPASTNGGRA